MNRLMNGAAAAALLAPLATVPWGGPATAAEADNYCWNAGSGAARFVPCQGTVPLAVTQGGPAVGQTALAAAATGTTLAVQATLTAAAGQTTFICGFDAAGIGGSADIGPITVANLIGTITYTYHIANSASGVVLEKTFTPCIPAQAPNTAITVTTTADGTATAVDVNAWGFRQ